MPELPEVETIRRDLARKLKGRCIRSVTVGPAKVTTPRGAAFQRLVAGAVVRGVRRRGKLLLFDLALSRGVAAMMLVHLKMTGQLVLTHKQKLIFGGHAIVGVSRVPNKYTHVTFHFTNADTLYFNDLRRFGYVKLVKPEEAKRVESTYGVEPLARAFTLSAFELVLRRRSRTTIKAALLDQRGVAGIGNIYADEACFRAHVKPSRRVATLSAAEQRSLWQAIKSVLVLSIKYRGTSFNTYVDAAGKTGGFWSHRFVYGRGGEQCRRCGTVLKRIVVVGRGTVYCANCQK